MSKRMQTDVFWNNVRKMAKFATQCNFLKVKLQFLSPVFEFVKIYYFIKDSSIPSHVEPNKAKMTYRCDPNDLNNTNDPNDPNDPKTPK